MKNNTSKKLMVKFYNILRKSQENLREIMSFQLPRFKTKEIFFDCTCSICGNNQERICRLDAKFDIKDCCSSLVCKECLKKNDSKTLKEISYLLRLSEWQ